MMGLLKRLSDPELVMYVMRIVNPSRRDHEEGCARKFHVGLRVDKDERWKKTKDLSKARKFHHMNACVPITCTLPFDGGMWRVSCELLKTIRFFRETFLREETHLLVGEAEVSVDREQTFSGKIKTLNLLLSDSVKGRCYRRGWTSMEITEALNDLEVFDEDISDDEEKPCVLVKRGGYIDIIN